MKLSIALSALLAIINLVWIIVVNFKTSLIFISGRPDHSFTSWSSHFSGGAFQTSDERILVVVGFQIHGYIAGKTSVKPVKAVKAFHIIHSLLRFALVNLPLLGPLLGLSFELLDQLVFLGKLLPQFWHWFLQLLIGEHVFHFVLFDLYF